MPNRIMTAVSKSNGSMLPPPSPHIPCVVRRQKADARPVAVPLPNVVMRQAKLMPLCAWPSDRTENRMLLGQDASTCKDVLYARSLATFTTPFLYHDFNPQTTTCQASSSYIAPLRLRLYGECVGVVPAQSGAYKPEVRCLDTSCSR